MICKQSVVVVTATGELTSLALIVVHEVGSVGKIKFLSDPYLIYRACIMKTRERKELVIYNCDLSYVLHIVDIVWLEVQIRARTVSSIPQSIYIIIYMILRIGRSSYSVAVIRWN